MRGRKPIPTHLKVLRGNPGHQALRPEREPDYEAAPDIPEPPAFLMPARQGRVAAHRHRLVSHGLADAGRRESAGRVLPSVWALGHRRSITCENGRARSAHQRLDDQDHRRQRDSEPAGRHRQQSASDMVRYATEFGFTPAARARIAAGTPDGSAKSKFAGLIGGLGGSEADAARKAARRARYQVYRNPDGPERDGTGQAGSSWRRGRRRSSGTSTSRTRMGRRVVRRAILSIARKNGKTALIATLALAHLIGPEAIPNGEIYRAANDRDQAAIVFKFARQIVELRARAAGDDRGGPVDQDDDRAARPDRSIARSRRKPEPSTVICRAW